MGIDTRYPDKHTDFIQRCHQAGQVRPTPLLLQYDQGDYNCLHQDLDGEHVFPIQVAFLLSEPDLRKLVRAVAKRAGIKRRIHPHLFRHSLATNLLVRGTGVLAIKEQMGHVYLETTMRYLHSTPRRLQEEYRMHMPSYL